MEIVMHYYTFNIGDYRRDTSHLTLLEHGIYRQLIDTYYLSEKPLDKDLDTLMRSHCVRNADEMRALENVLKDFFELTENGYFHKGCDRQVKQFKSKSEKARLSAEARWKPNQSEGSANGMRSHSDGNANGMLTNNHKPITNKKTTSVVKPDDVSQAVWDDYRVSRKVALTPTALQTIVNEAKKAGWTTEDALRESILRGWRGFKAEWVLKNKPQANGRVGV
jgi:uncharacterized protein YdaU (DUF1376 family)